MIDVLRMTQTFSHIPGLKPSALHFSEVYLQPEETRDLNRHISYVEEIVMFFSGFHIAVTI